MRRQTEGHEIAIFSAYKSPTKYNFKYKLIKKRIIPTIRICSREIELCQYMHYFAGTL